MTFLNAFDEPEFVLDEPVRFGDRSDEPDPNTGAPPERGWPKYDDAGREISTQNPVLERFSEGVPHWAHCCCVHCRRVEYRRLDDYAELPACAMCREKGLK